MSSELQQQIDDMKARISALERGVMPRLGPQAPSQAELDERTQRLIDEVKAKAAADAPPVDRTKLCTTKGDSVEHARANQTAESGQHKSYVVLCPEERAKGFVRPYRDAYRHVGKRPKYPTRELTDQQHAEYDRYGYVKFEPYPEDSPESQGGNVTGKYWTQAELSAGCGKVTTMGRALSETYQRDPSFYGSTFCATCNKHFPVDQFVWTADGIQVGS